MGQALFSLGLGTALAFLLRSLLNNEGEGGGGHPALLGLFSVFPFVLLWAAEPSTIGPEIDLADPFLAVFLMIGTILGASAYASSRRSLAGLGAVAGFSGAIAGYCAYRWAFFAPSLFGGGTFAVGVIWAGIPLALAATSAVISGAMLHCDLKPLRWGLVSITLGLWALSAHLSERYLRTSFDYGFVSLAQASGARPAEHAPSVAVAILVPGEEGETYVETRTLADEHVALGRRDLVNIRNYLRGRGYMSLFLKEGIAAERRGWLLNWDVPEALAAKTLAMPGDFPPDYRGALALIRSGPLTDERYEMLEDLAALAGENREGFESVGQSQYIYEAFSAAYARFGDHDKAREWLLRVYDLWPLFEKEVEVAPVEYMRDGEISGSVMLDGNPARGILVGVFYTAKSTGPYFALKDLCCSQRLDSSGQYRFQDLGPGEYYLGLQAPEGWLKGEILNSPGFVMLSADSPRAPLGPIWIESKPGPLSLISGGKKSIMWTDEADRAIKGVARPRSLRRPQGVPR